MHIKLSDAKWLLPYLPFIRAAAEGKVIEYYDGNADRFIQLDDALGHHITGSEPHNLRIKPTPKLRLWNGKDAIPVGALLKTRGARCHTMITGYDDLGVFTGWHGGDRKPYQEVFNDWLWKLPNDTDWKDCSISD